VPGTAAVLRIIAPMHGLHLTADLRGCAAAAPLMTDPEALRRHCLQAVRQAGLTAVGEVFHPFPPPGGVTGVVLLAESHLAVHTWPEIGGVTLDVYVCNLHGDNRVRAAALLAALEAGFGATQAHHQRLDRGAARGV
jgi:S-adenosylmethionine decarboxylase